MKICFHSLLFLLLAALCTTAKDNPKEQTPSLSRSTPSPPTKAFLSTKRRKILVTNIGVSGSQNLMMGRLADLLASRPGNDVTLLQYELLPKAKKVKLERAKLITFMANENVETQRKAEEMLKTTPWEKHAFFNPAGLASLVALMAPLQTGCANLLMNHSSLVEQLKAEKFDAIIIHLGDICTHGLSEHFGIKATAWFSTGFLFDPMSGFTGVESPASYVPVAALESTDQMGFVERFKTFLMRYLLMSDSYGISPVKFVRGCIHFSPFLLKSFEIGMLGGYDKIFERRFGANFPKVRDIIRNTQLFMLNSDPFFEYSRPMQANIIEVGGFSMTNPEPLKTEWLKLLENERTDGAVLFSLGTVANTSGMPMEMKMAFVNAFKRFPRYTFIMRIEGEFPEAKEVPYIHLTKWVPQKDLLAHPKLKAFITHGGYNSLTEAAFLGVPLVVLPLFSDQGGNAKRVERRRHGVVLDKHTITEQKIFNALDHVLNDKEVARRAKYTSTLMQNKPFSSEETAMRWIEFLADYKDLDVLKPESRRMSFIKYHNLDVIATLLVIVGLKLYLTYLLCIRCYRCCSNKPQRTRAVKKRQ